MAGRPTEKTEEVLRKIEEAASLGASIEEIAFHAGIHRATLYRWMKEDEELNDRIDELQQRPILAARTSVVKSIETNPEMAMRYLERKKRNEFATKQEQEHSGSIKTYVIERGGNNLSPAQTPAGDSGESTPI